MSFIKNYPCAVCVTPLEVQLEEVLFFPDDARVLLDSIAIKPIAIQCPLCKTPSLAAPSIIIVDAENQRAIVNGREDDVRPAMEQALAQVESPLNVIYCPEYTDMWNLLAAWAGQHVQRAMLPLLHDDVEEETDEDGRPLYLSFFVLLALSYALDLRMPFGLRTDPPLPEDEKRRFDNDMLIALSTDALKSAYKVAFHTDIAALASVVRRNIPYEAIRPETLQRLIGECVARDDILKDIKLIDRAFRFEYLTAVAHRHVALPNPREREWCRLMITMAWLFNEGLPGRTDERFLLTPSTLRETISFPTFYEALAHDLGLNEEQPGEQRVKLAEKIAKRFGYEGEAAQAFGTRIRIFDATPYGSDEELAERFKKDALDARARDHGRVVALGAGRQFAETLVVNRRPRAALLLAIYTLETFSRGDEEFIRTLCRTAEMFNNLRAFDETAELLNRYHHSIAPLLEKLPPEVAVDYLNERANTLRYLHQPVKAIGLYEYSLAFLADNRNLDDERRTLYRNMAIALREADQPTASRSMLLDLLSNAKNETERVQLRQNLIATLFTLHAYDEALPYAMQNASAARGGADLRRRLIALLQVATAKARTATPLEGELELAYRLIVVAPAMATLVASVTFFAARHLDVEQTTIEMAVDMVVKQELDVSRESPLLVSYAEWQAHCGDVTGARATMNRIVESFGNDHRSMPWQWGYFLYRLHDDEPFEQRWTRLRSALMHLDQDLPVDTAGLAMAAWLNETDDLLRDLVPAAKEAYRRGLADANNLLAVADMTGGRDVVRRTSAETQATVQVPPGTIVTFLEDERDIWCVTCRLDRSFPAVTSLVLDTVETRAISSQFQRSIQRALPHQPSRAETLIEPLLRRIGGAIAATVAAGQHVCFVPSPSLLGVPLNACSIKDGTLLLARNTISIAANVSLVANLVQNAPPELASASVIAVSKRGDSDEFRERLGAASTTLFRILGKSGEHLDETAAAKMTCFATIERSDLVVLLCHGADAGAAYGRGFCVSDGRDLPPPLLPVIEAPALRRFIIDGADIENLSRAPAFVSTIACSLGLTIAGRGGTRVGIERSLFMNGTQTMIAPLWDVAQTEALQFIVDFHRSCGENPQWDYARAFQSAALLAYERSTHLFDWAPMQLRGSWRRSGGTS